MQQAAHECVWRAQEGTKNKNHNERTRHAKRLPRLYHCCVNEHPTPTYPNPTDRPSADRHERGELRWVRVLLRVDDPLQDEQLPQRGDARAGAHRRRRGVERPGARIHQEDRYVYA